MADDYMAQSNANEHLEEGETLEQPLPQDNQRPFSAPTDAVDDPTVDLEQRAEGQELDPTHQATDNATDLDPTQLYNEDLAGAAEASEPNRGNTVVGYDPDNDQRRQP